MNAYERMLDLIEREIASTSPEEWTDADVIIRIREIEGDDQQQAERDGAAQPEPLTNAECQRVVNRVLHPGWGGLRPNAGRPLLYDEHLVSISITLPQQAIDALAEIGEGNVSQGIRTMWEGWHGS